MKVKELFYYKKEWNMETHADEKIPTEKAANKIKKYPHNVKGISAIKVQPSALPLF